MKNLVCFSALMACQVWGLLTVLNNMAEDPNIFEKVASLVIMLGFWEAFKIWGKELLKFWSDEFVADDPDDKYGKIDIREREEK